VEARVQRIAVARRRRAEPEANTRLTTLTAAVLLVLLAVEGLTLLSLQSFVSWHIVVGMLLVPVVGLKVVSTGYRFVRYYTRDEAYVRAGPPPIVLRLVGPVLVAATAGLFATGVALAALGPGAPFVLLLHKATFAVWFGAMTVHVLGHLARLPKLASADMRAAPYERGPRLRLTALATAIAAGAVLAVATLPLVAPWTHWTGGAG
jgi:hypothetical protein